MQKADGKAIAKRLAIPLADRYEIERELGHGGMAFVYLARDRKHGRLVAIKALRPDLSATLGVERFLREIEIAAVLQHPHIVPLYDSGSADDIVFYVMPFVEGESLRDRLARESQLPLDEALHLVREVADALGYAHSHGVVHRDIKPENILLTGGHALVADFGVARAVSAAADDRLTDTGLAIGTPAYMSPEQAGGAGDIDGRSDLYSLGCVLYEMLVGEPPFTGLTPQAVLARHMQERPPHVRIVRPTVPDVLEQCVEKLLAKVPADRYATAGQFIDALTRPSDSFDAVVRRGPPPSTMVGIAALILVLGGGALLGGRFLFPRASVDPLHYLVLPFETRPGAESEVLDGAQSQWRLSQALKRWDSIRVGDPFVLRDAVKRHGEGTLTHSEWLSVAREMGTGTMVRGELTQLSDTVYLNATAYDVSDGSVVRQATVEFAPEDHDVRERFEMLAARLVGLAAAQAAAGVRSTRSLEAGRAFSAAQQALTDGAFAEAERLLLEATRTDPAFADAHFWLAQVRIWRGRDAEMLSGFAQQALDLREALTDPRAQRLVAPLVDLARGRWAEACDKYNGLLRRDSSDFAAWFGLGECRWRDPVVVPDAASASGWRFRSSYHAAAEAYRRGLASAPALTGGVFRVLTRLLVVERGRFRQGWTAGSDSAAFWAYPSLSADTLAYVPYPRDMVANGVVDEPQTLEAALARNRSTLSEIATRWAEAFPHSAEAQVAVAYTLEELARAGHGAAPLANALQRIQRARDVARDSNTAVILVHTQIRLLLKLSRFETARTLADSLLRAARDPDPRLAHRLAGLAALLGRPHRAAQLLELGLPYLERLPREARRGEIPAPLLVLRERLRSYAALGSPADSLRAIAARADSVGALWGGDRDRTIRRSLLAEPLALAFSVTGPGSVHDLEAPHYLVTLQALLSRGDTTTLRSELEALTQMRRDLRPQDISVGMTYQETWLRLQLGDTTGTVEAVDRVLLDLPAFPNHLLRDVVDPAALVRTMVLRAQLAVALGDDAAAQRWAGAVVSLWSGADDDGLRSVVRAMRDLVR